MALHGVPDPADGRTRPRLADSPDEPAVGGASPAAWPPAGARAAARPAPQDPALTEMHFFTVAEVAEVMRVSRMTVYRLVHSGELPAVRVGRSFRVPQRAVHDYLRAAFTDAG